MTYKAEIFSSKMNGHEEVIDFIFHDDWYGSISSGSGL